THTASPNTARRIVVMWNLARNQSRKGLYQQSAGVVRNGLRKPRRQPSGAREPFRGRRRDRHRRSILAPSVRSHQFLAFSAPASPLNSVWFGPLIFFSSGSNSGGHPMSRRSSRRAFTL